MIEELVFHAIWAELAAGIRPGYERVTIRFEHGQPIDEEVLAYWRESVRDFYDGAKVYTETEWAEMLERQKRTRATSGPGNRNGRVTWNAKN